MKTEPSPTMTLPESITSQHQALGLFAGASEPRLLQREIKDGKLILTFRRESPPNHWPQYSGQGVEYWRDIYAASNGGIVMEKTEKANYTPARVTVEPEKIEWPNQPV